MLKTSPNELVPLSGIPFLRLFLGLIYVVCLQTKRPLHCGIDDSKFFIYNRLWMKNADNFFVLLFLLWKQRHFVIFIG